MSLLQCWRWYGPQDPVSLQDIKQAGATGIVTALHHLETGEVWPHAEIAQRKRLIEQQGLKWQVVESVNIHDAIKLGTSNRDYFIDQYCATLEHLSQNDIKTVCYNFMPVLDWTRTELDFPTPSGAKALRYNPTAVAAFDKFILQRAEAAHEYDPQIWNKADQYWSELNELQQTKLSKTLLAGVPGTQETLSLDYFKSKLSEYKGVNREILKSNYKYFIQKVAPVAQQLNIKLGVHPDDPPFGIFGLPRIVSTPEDLEYILHCSDLSVHGLTLCTGSLGPSCAAQIPNLIKRYGSRIHFLHLRNIKFLPDGSFYEADHLEGEVDMVAVMKELLVEMKRRKSQGVENWRIPMRPDHGHQMLDDLNKEVLFPGYSGIGRLKGLAELRGLELGLSANL